MQLKWLIGIRTSLNIKLVIVVRVTLALFHRTGLKFQEKQIFFTFKSCKMFVTQAHLYRSKMGFSFFRPFRRIVMWFFTWLLFNSKTAIIPSCILFTLFCIRLPVIRSIFTKKKFYSNVVVVVRSRCRYIEWFNSSQFFLDFCSSSIALLNRNQLVCLWQRIWWRKRSSFFLLW